MPAKSSASNPLMPVGRWTSWRFTSDNSLPNRVLTAYEGLLKHRRAAWERLIDHPRNIWAHRPA